jgi:hypothetical protein
MTGLLQASVFGLALASAGGACAADASFDGTWSGKLGREKPWPVTIVIAKGKVIGFSEKGVPFEVRFSKATANGLVFGDGSNYQVELSKSGADAVSAQVHGRLGTGPARLTRS